MTPALDVARRGVRLDPRDPGFFNDPYRAYCRDPREALGHLLGDPASGASPPRRRVGAAARPPFRPPDTPPDEAGGIGWPEPQPAIFSRSTRSSAIRSSSLSRPSTRAAQPRQSRLRLAPDREVSGRASPRCASSGSTASRHEGSADLIAEFAAPIPVAVIADLLGVPRQMGANSSTGRTGWSRCTNSASTAQSRNARPRRRGRSPISSAALRVRGAATRRRSHQPAPDRRKRRRKIERGRTGCDGDPASERGPRGDGPGDRQRGENDARGGRRPAARIRGRKRDRGDGRGAAARSTRRFTSFSATRWKTPSSPACGLGRATGSAFFSAPPIAIRRAFPIPTPSTAGGRRNPHVAFRRRHSFLRRRAAGAARAWRRAADPVRPPAGPASRRAAALPRHVPFSWA